MAPTVDHELLHMLTAQGAKEVMQSTHPCASSPAQPHAKLLLCQRGTPSHTKSCRDAQSTHPFLGSVQKISPLVAHITLRHVRGDSNEQGPTTGEIKTLGGGQYNYRLLATVAHSISGRNPSCWKCNFHHCMKPCWGGSRVWSGARNPTESQTGP